jgi:hypothetical protein
MRKPSWTPSIVPRSDDQTVYIVVADFGRKGRDYRETDVEAAHLETTIMNLLKGEYSNAVRVVVQPKKWSQDVSADIAQEIRRRFDLHLHDVPSSIQDFVEPHEDYNGQQLTLRLT